MVDYKDKEYVPKPGTVTEFIYKLGRANPEKYAGREGAPLMHEAATKAGFDVAIQTIHALRSQFGFSSRELAAAKPAAEKPLPATKKSKGKKRRKQATAAPVAPAAATNGHRKGALSSLEDADDLRSFRRMLRRLGTVQVRSMLDEAEREG